MSTPKVQFTLTDGNLGRVNPSEDGVTLMVITAPGTYTPTGLVYDSLQAAESAGVTEAEDIARDALVWEHVKDFYAEAGNGQELHLLLLANTVTFTNLFTSGNAAYTALKAKLTALKGRVRLLAVAVNPSGAETAGTGLSSDLATAIPLAQSFWATELEEYRPCQIYLEGRKFGGTPAGATSLRTLNASRVMVVVGRDKLRRVVLVADSGIPLAENYAAVGLAVGRAAAIQVHRNIGRVKDGPVVGIVEAELSGGQLMSDYTPASVDTLYDKGYVFLKAHIGKDGFYWVDDSTAVSLTSDYAFASRGRTIDKAIRRAYAVMVENLLDNVDVNTTTGRLAISTCKAWEADIEEDINRNMTAFDEIEAVSAFIDPNQDVLTTDEVEVQLALTPKGTARKIVVKIGFSKTAQ